MATAVLPSDAMIGQTLKHYEVEAELGRGGMGVDVSQSHLDFCDPVWLGGGFCLLQQFRSFAISLQNHFDQGFRSAGCFLCDGTDARMAWHRA